MIVLCLEVKALPNIGKFTASNVLPQRRPCQSSMLYFENRGDLGNSISDWPRDHRGNGRLSSPCLTQYLKSSGTCSVFYCMQRYGLLPMPTTEMSAHILYEKGELLRID